MEAPLPRGDVTAIVLIAVGAAATVAAIGVGGDFPLSDDWSYAFTARRLCTDGVVQFLPWTGASLVLQAGYGAALCHFFGFSFEVLRISTVVLAVAGALGFHLMLGRAGVAAAPRALGTVLFALGPLYVNLAFTFMTDVPFAAFAVLAGYGYVRGLDQRRWPWLVLGSLFAAAALLVRQHGIFVAMAAALAALLAADRSWRARVAAAVASGALPALTFLVFQVWLFAWHGAPAGVEMKVTEARGMSAIGIANCAFRGLASLGLLLAPLALALGRDTAARRPRLLAAFGLVLAVLAGGLYLHERASMFYLTNVMYDLGLGASSLRDTLFLALRPPVEIGRALTLPLTVVAIAASTVLAATWVGGWRRLREPVPAFLLLATALLFLGTLLHARYYFDRYLLAVVPFAIAAALVVGAARPTRASVLLAAVLVWYAVAGTHDYLAWNRARFAGLAALTAASIPPTAIDGGMEFNAWHLAPTLGTWPSNAQARPGQPHDAKSWWWVVDDRFVASFRPLPGYAVRATLPYPRWLALGTGHVVILERAPAQSE